MPQRLEKLRAAQAALLTAYGTYLEAQAEALEFFINSPATASAAIPPAARMPADEVEATPEPAPAPAAKAEPAKEVTLDDVRAVCVKAGGAGKSAGVKQLLATYGVERVTALKPEQYADFIAAVEGL